MKHYILLISGHQYDPESTYGIYSKYDMEKHPSIRRRLKTISVYCTKTTKANYHLHLYHSTELTELNVNPRVLAPKNYPQSDIFNFYFTKSQVKQIKKAIRNNNLHNFNNPNGMTAKPIPPYDNNGINFAKNYQNWNLPLQEPVVIPVNLIDKLSLQAIRDLELSKSGAMESYYGDSAYLQMLRIDIESSSTSAEAHKYKRILAKRKQKILPPIKAWKHYEPTYEKKFVKASTKYLGNDIEFVRRMRKPRSKYILITDQQIIRDTKSNHKPHQLRVITGYNKQRVMTRHVSLKPNVLIKQPKFNFKQINDLRHHMYANHHIDYRHLVFVAVPINCLSLITPTKLYFILRNESNRVAQVFVESDELTVRDWMLRDSSCYTRFQLPRNYVELHEHFTKDDLKQLPNTEALGYGYDNC